MNCVTSMVRNNDIYTNIEKSPRFNKQLILFIQGAPAISMHGTAAFPVFKVKCSPANVEECKYDEAHIISELQYHRNNFFTSTVLVIKDIRNTPDKL